MRLWSLIGLGCCWLLLSAGEQPAIGEPPPTERNFTISGNALMIQPGEETSYLRFYEGVTVIGPEFTLSAELVELDVLADESALREDVKLPKQPEEDERIVADPGGVAAEMARELKMPTTTFDPGALKRVAAAGHVRIIAHGVELTAAELISVDGGRTWAGGRTELSYTDPQTGGAYRLGADHVVFDAAEERALARGAISASFTGRDQMPVTVAAGLCEVDIGNQSFILNDGIRAEQGALSLECGELAVDLQRRTLHTAGELHLVNDLAEPDEELGLLGQPFDAVLVAEALELDLTAELAMATGGVELTERRRKLGVVAQQVDADLAAGLLTLSGEAELTYGDSSYSGSEIRATFSDEDLVIEVEGPQHLRLDLEQLQQRHSGTE